MEDYIKIAEYIIENIENGEFEIGSQILTEHQLSKMFQVNRYTVRKAIERLKNLGYLHSTQGRGCYVSDKTIFIEYPVKTGGNFSDNLTKLEKKYHNKLLNWSLFVPNVKEKEALQLNDSDKAYKLTIIRYVDHEPIALYISTLPEKLVPDLSLHLDDFNSLHKILKEKYQCTPVCKNYSIETTFPNHEDILRLNIPTNYPLFITRTVNMQENKKPIEYTIARMRGDRIKFFMDFSQMS